MPQTRDKDQKEYVYDSGKKPVKETTAFDDMILDARERMNASPFGVGFNYSPTAKPTYDSKWQPMVDKTAMDYFSRGAYTPTWNEQINEIAEGLKNRQPFKYDLNADELYHQYRAQFMRNGRSAMDDTMGKAQQMSGGFGNSYAQQVGQQTYDKYMGELNDIVPELYSLAESRYAREGDEMRKNLAMYEGMEDRERSAYDKATQDIYNRLNAANALENTEYGRYRNDVSDWQNEENMRFKTAQEQADLAKWSQQQNYNARLKAADDAISLLKMSSTGNEEEKAAALDAFNKMTPAQVVDAMQGYKDKVASGEITEAEARNLANALVTIYGNDKPGTPYSSLVAALDTIFPENGAVDTSNPNKQDEKRSWIEKMWNDLTK
jgi:hypothetical protein